MKEFLDVDSFWFRKPLIGSVESLENFKYVSNSCPKSEDIGERIINIPANLNNKNQDILYTKLIEVLKKLSQ